MPTMHDLLSVFERHESNVRSYCRSFPTVFATAQNARMTDVSGRSYIDLLSGAGTLNYGHNNPVVTARVIAYLQGSGIAHGLDLHTRAKAEFLIALQEIVLAPRGLDYKVQFPGPTGTNAVEAALKLARKATGRQNVVAFTNGFHGMTLGALSATANPAKRGAAGLPLGSVTFMPYEGFLGEGGDAYASLEAMLTRPGSGIDAPAAILIELVQGEGGLNAASVGFTRRLAELARRIGAVLVVDDIQAGNGRTGRFFSFEEAGIAPDVVVLSKSLSGFGSPLSVVLMRPDLDVWSPGEHNGTFRGNNLAFVGATAAIEAYWSDARFSIEVVRKSEDVAEALARIAAALPAGAARVKGRGLMTGIAFAEPGFAAAVADDLFADGVVVETCGPGDEVLKLLPPLTIPDADLEEALALIAAAVERRAGARVATAAERAA